MELEDTKNGVTTLNFSFPEFEVVRRSFFKRNTQKALLLKEVMSFLHPYVRSVEIRQDDMNNVDFNFYLPFTCDVHNLLFQVGMWKANGNYCLSLYYEDKTSLHFLNVLKTNKELWDEDNGYLRYAFCDQIKLRRLHKFLEVVVDKIDLLNRITTEPCYEI